MDVLWPVWNCIMVPMWPIQSCEPFNPLTHDQMTHDPLTHDPLTNDPLTYDPLTHDSLTHDPLTYDSLTHDPLIHDPLTHDALNHEWPMTQWPNDLWSSDPLSAMIDFHHGIWLLAVFLPFKQLHHGTNLTQWQRQQLKNACTRSSFLTTGRNIPWDRFFVSDENQYIYWSIPKVACSSWILTLLKLTGKDLSRVTSVHIPNITDTFVKRAVMFTPAQRRMLLKKYYKFMTVREPLERLVSAYRDKCLYDPDFSWLSLAIRKRRLPTNNAHQGETAKH